MIRAVSFDLDETLWPVWPAIVGAELALYEWLCDCAPAVARAFPPEQMRSLRGEVNALSLAAGHGHDPAWIRRTQIRLAFERSGEQPDPARIATAYGVFEAARQQVEPFPEVPTVLAEIAARLPLVAITNGNADLKRIALGHHFKASFSAGQFGVAKPDPAIFLAACDHLGCAPHEVLHVGDDPALDVVAARAVGMQTVWLNRHNTPWPLEHPIGAQAPDLHGVLALMS